MNAPASSGNTAASRRIVVKLVLIAVVIAIWYVKQTWFTPAPEARPENAREVAAEISPVEKPAPEQPASVSKTSEEGDEPARSNSVEPATKKLPAVNTPTAPAITPSAPAKPPSTNGEATTPPQPQRKGVYVENKIAYNVVLLDLNDNVVYRGTVDLSSTLERIDSGKRLTQFQNDGVIFRNRERRLPIKPEGYYREWVHPTPKLSGPGPQRIVTGQQGDAWYTPDHYERFYQVRKP